MALQETKCKGTFKALCSLVFLLWVSPIQGFQLPSSPIATSNNVQPTLYHYSNHRLHFPVVSSKISVQSSEKSSDSNSNDNNEDSPGKRQRAVLKLKNFVNTASRRFVSTKNRIATNFQRLSKKSKLLVSGYIMAIVLILGSMGRTAYVRANSPDLPVNRKPIEITYSSFMDIVESQSQSQSNKDAEALPTMDKVRIAPDRISFRLSKQSEEDDRVKYLTAYTRKPPASSETINYLRSNQIEFSAASNANKLIAVYGLRSLLFTIYGLFLWRMYQAMRGATGSNNKDTPGKLLQQQSDVPLASFADIQGIDDAKNEVMELVDTLRNPEKYSILGARAPTGLLLEGPPGTGKTMLARATAATAGVPLLYCSGSDFVEMYVGRGAGRVRRMFERANKLAPAIIFIDEIDTVGKARDSNNVFGNMARSNDEAEQTINQLLSCMDGLDSSKRICVLAATNRKDVLDPALVRPGRFDRIVTLRLPDAKGRENILRIHAKKLPGFEEGSGVDPNRKLSLGKGTKVDLAAVAAVTEGLSGAELEFIVNEAAIRAVRRVSAAIRQGQDPGTAHVDAEDFETSVANFFATRRKGGNSAGDVLKNVFK